MNAVNALAHFGKASASFHADAQFAHSLEFNAVQNLDGSNKYSNLENNNSAVQHLDDSSKYSNEEKITMQYNMLMVWSGLMQILVVVASIQFGT